MMDIHLNAFTAPAAVAAAPASSAGPALQSHAWLREMEQARWQAQPRYAPASEQGDRPQPQDAEYQPGVRARPKLEPATAPPVQRATAQAPESAASRLATEHLATHCPAASRPSTSHPELLAQASQAFVYRDAERRRAPPPVPAVPTRMADKPWALRQVHVQPGEEALSVWVRDAQLDAPQARALAEQLALLSEHPSARRTVRLVVNGQPVDADAAPSSLLLSIQPGAHRGD